MFSDGIGGRLKALASTKLKVKTANRQSNNRVRAYRTHPTCWFWSSDWFTGRVCGVATHAVGWICRLRLAGKIVGWVQNPTKQMNFTVLLGLDPTYASLLFFWKNAGFPLRENIGFENPTYGELRLLRGTTLAILDNLFSLFLDWILLLPFVLGIIPLVLKQALIMFLQSLLHLFYTAT